MKLSHETIVSFRDLVKRKSGVELTEEEALKEASDLLTLMDLVYQKIPLKHEHNPEEHCTL